jgi:Tol biopolymer transport system component
LKPVLSPDGRQTAIFMMDEGKWLIGLMSTDSGEHLKKIDLPTIVNQRRIRWHPNGKFLTMIFNVGDNLKLLLLPTDGGSPRIIEGLGKGDVNSFSWSRDGKQLLYSLTDEIQDVVLISNVE